MEINSNFIDYNNNQCSGFGPFDILVDNSVIYCSSSYNLIKLKNMFDYENIEGTLVGLYCPPYMADLNATGWHLHFISKDKSKGGHVLGINISNATLIWDDTDIFQMILPENDMFASFDLTIDQSEDIKKVETDIRQ